MLQLLHQIQTALGMVWDVRFSEVLSKSREATENGLSPEQAYRRGYADGYWQGTADLTGVLREAEYTMLHMAHRHQAQPLPPWQPLIEEVH